MIPKQKNTFGPKYSIFWVKIAHFHPYRPIGATPVNVFNTKEVSHWFPDIRIPKVKLHPLQKRSFGPKRPNAASNWHLWPNIGIFGPIDLMPDQKKMRTGCPSGSIMWVPKLLLTPIKIRLFGPKTAKFGPKSAFLVILGQILPFFAHFVQCPTKNKFEQGAWVGFLLCG